LGPHECSSLLLAARRTFAATEVAASCCTTHFYCNLLRRFLLHDALLLQPTLPLLAA
jgi:hypothetical protein